MTKNDNSVQRKIMDKVRKSSAIWGKAQIDANQDGAMYNGIGKESCILSCCHLPKRLAGIFSVHN